MFECPKCKSNNINILTETHKGHEVEALCLCEECLTGFEYWKMWEEQKRAYIEHHRTIKY
jgi:hypothetical protein